MDAPELVEGFLDGEHQADRRPEQEEAAERAERAAVDPSHEGLEGIDEALLGADGDVPEDEAFDP